MLVVLEGLDGAGKSTQVKRLKKYLEDTRPALEYIHFPRYEAPVYGDLISRFLRGDFGDNQTVHPQLVALLFAEDRHGAGPIINWIFNTEYGNFALPVPDINLFLDVPIDFVKENLSGDRKGDDGRSYLEGSKDIHEADISFQRDVREIYLQETVRDPRFRRIDCSDAKGRMLPPDAIFEKVRNAVNQVL